MPFGELNCSWQCTHVPITADPACSFRPRFRCFFDRLLTSPPMGFPAGALTGFVKAPTDNHIKRHQYTTAHNSTFFQTTKSSVDIQLGLLWLTDLALFNEWRLVTTNVTLVAGESCKCVQHVLLWYAQRARRLVSVQIGEMVIV